MRRSSTMLAAVLVVTLGLAACTTTSTTSSDDEPDVSTDLLHKKGLAEGAITALSRKIGSEAPRSSYTTVYPEYLIVEAQDPNNAEHIDRYEWRDDEVADPTPVHLSGPQEDIEASLFPLRSVHWEDLPTMVRDAERAAAQASPIRVEEARASYVNVDRTPTSDGDSRVVVRIYIEGPRRSGYVELTTTGEVLSVNVS